MKAIILFIILSLTPLLRAQIPANLTCSGAIQICDGNRIFQDFVFEGTPLCTQAVKIYYYLTCAQTSPSAHVFSVSSGSTPVTCKVYGLYDELSDACEQINLLAAPVTVSTVGGSHTLSTATQLGKILVLEITIHPVTQCKGQISVYSPPRVMNCNLSPCDKCMTDFQLPVGKYVISAWVMEENVSKALTSYGNSNITVNAGGTSNSFYPSGQIIDGWQRIEGQFSVITPGSFSVDLMNTNVSSGYTASYFDDIRIFPLEGSMMSYVYDPLTLRLSAELDERNYAKFYEYDEEGKLIRVKKETEFGISTIQESRNNSAGQ